MGLRFKTAVQGRPLWACGPTDILSKLQNELRERAAWICEGRGFQAEGPEGQRPWGGETLCVFENILGKVQRGEVTEVVDPE